MFLRVERIVPAAGIAFVVLVVLAALIRNPPDRTAGDAEWLAYFADSGSRRNEFIAFFLVGLAVFFFLSWLGSLRGFLVRAEGEPSRITAAAISAGSAFVALAAAAHAIGTSPSWAVEAFEDRFRIDANVVRLTSAVEYTLFVMSLFAAATMTLAASVLGLHSRIFPRWLAILGVLATAGAVLGFLVWPSVFVLAWIVAMSLFMLWPRGLGRTSSSSPQASAPSR